MSTFQIDVSSVTLFLGQAGMPGGSPAPAAPGATTAAPAATTGAPGSVTTPATTPTTTPTTTPAATTGAATGQSLGGTGSQPGAMSLMFPLMMVGLLVFMIFISMMTGRKEKKRREALMNSLGKGDKISTSSGIIGTITEMTDTEVVIRSEDTKIRLAKSAIAGVLSSSTNKGASGTIEAKEAGKAVGV